MAVSPHAVLYDVGLKATWTRSQLLRSGSTKTPPIGRLVLILRRRTHLAHSNSCPVYLGMFCWKAF